MNRTPLTHGFFSFSPSFLGGRMSASSFSGRLPPWYQVRFKAGSSLRSGNVYRTISHGGVESGCTGGPSASAVSGYLRSSAQKGKSMKWHPKSASAPPPKAHQFRQAKGTHSLL